MTKTSNLVRMIQLIGIVLGTLTLGCGSSSNQEGFEGGTTDAPLPEGWELLSSSGNYRAAKTADAKTGSAALAIAGSKGDASLISKPFDLGKNEAVQYSFGSNPRSSPLKAKSLMASVIPPAAKLRP